MVVTVVLSGLPKYVTLRDLAYNLDKVFTSDYITKFHVRDLPNHPSTNKRRVALDFPSGFDGAMDAQFLLHGYKYTLDNGREYTLSAKINHDPELDRTTSFCSATDPNFETALVQYQDEMTCVTHKNILNMHLDTLRQQIEITRNERLLLKEQKKLRKAKETKEEGTMPKKKTKSAKYVADSDSSVEMKTLKHKKVKKEKKKKKKKKKKHRHLSSSESHVDVSSRDSSPVVPKKIKRSPSFDSRTSRDRRKSTPTSLVPYREEIRRSESNIPRQYRSPSVVSKSNRDLAPRSHGSLGTSKEKHRRSVSSTSSDLSSERDSREPTFYSLCRSMHRKQRLPRTSSASSQSSSASVSPVPSPHSSRHSLSSYHSFRDVAAKRPRRSPSPPVRHRRPSPSPSPVRYRRPSPSPVPERYRERPRSRDRRRSPPRYREPLLPPPRSYRPRSPASYRRRASPPSRYDVREHSVFVDKTIPSTSDHDCRVREVEEEDEAEGQYVDDLLQGVADAVENDKRVARKSPTRVNITINMEKESSKKDKTERKSKKKKTMPLPIKTVKEEESPKKKKKKKDYSDIKDLIPKPLVENIKTEKDIKKERDEKNAGSGDNLEEGEIYEIEDSDDDRQSNDSRSTTGPTENQYRTPYTPVMPWELAYKHSKKSQEKPKLVAKNPRFVLPIDKIMRSMKPAINSIGNGQWKLDWMLTPKLQKRLEDLLKGKGYMKTKDIVDLYRQHFPMAGDEEFVKVALQELDSGELALQVGDTVKQEKMVNGIEQTKSKERAESDNSQWVPLSQPKVEPDDEVLVLEEPKPVLDLTDNTEHANAGAESDVSDETVVLEPKAEVKREPDHDMVVDALYTEEATVSPSIITVKEKPPEEITTEAVLTENINTETVEELNSSVGLIKTEIGEISATIITNNSVPSRLAEVSDSTPNKVTQPSVKTELNDQVEDLAAVEKTEVGEISATIITNNSVPSRLAEVSDSTPNKVTRPSVKTKLNDQVEDLAAVEKTEVREISATIKTSNSVPSRLAEVSDSIPNKVTQPSVKTELNDQVEDLTAVEKAEVGEISATIKTSNSVPSRLAEVSDSTPNKVTQPSVKTELNDQVEDLAAVKKFVQEVRIDRNVINISDDSD